MQDISYDLKTFTNYTKHSDSRPLVAISDKKDVRSILKHAKYLIWFPKVILENIIKHFGFRP